MECSFDAISQTEQYQKYQVCLYSRRLFHRIRKQHYLCSLNAKIDQAGFKCVSVKEHSGMPSSKGYHWHHLVFPESYAKHKYSQYDSMVQLDHITTEFRYIYTRWHFSKVQDDEIQHVWPTWKNAFALENSRWPSFLSCNADLHTAVSRNRFLHWALATWTPTELPASEFSALTKRINWIHMFT